MVSLNMKNPSILGIIVGLLLILLGLAGYFAGGRASVTALIPAFFGIPLALTAALGLKSSLQKNAMHAASIFGLLGFIAPLGRIIPQAAKGEMTFNLATISMILMCVLCGIFFVACFKYFIDARKARNSNQPASS